MLSQHCHNQVCLKGGVFVGILFQQMTTQKYFVVDIKTLKHENSISVLSPAHCHHVSATKSHSGEALAILSTILSTLITINNLLNILGGGNVVTTC